MLVAAFSGAQRGKRAKLGFYLREKGKRGPAITGGFIAVYLCQ
jgi:hypothetical protein